MDVLGIQAGRSSTRNFSERESPLAGSRPLRSTLANGVTLWVDLGESEAANLLRCATPQPERTSFVGCQDGHLPAGVQRLDQSSFASGKEAVFNLERLIFFVPHRLSAAEKAVVDRCVTLVSANENCRVCLISSASVHFGDQRLLAQETALREQFSRVSPHACFVLRSGKILQSPLSRTQFQGAVAALYPLVSGKFRNCFVDDTELLSAIHELTEQDQPTPGRVYTFLGRNRLVRDVLAERASTGLLGKCLTGFAQVLRFFLVGYLGGLLFSLVARWRTTWRRWQCDTLEPASMAELLCLYNPLNARHVAIVGYNTGVTHFGWKFPNRTVVKTTASGKIVRVRGDFVDVDAGVTLKRVVNDLNREGRELYVVPNYSYITMGTIFFVPVHGSGSEVSTLGDTIEKVLLYDPATDRIYSAKRGEARFAETMYNPRSGVLVLRLRLRVRPKSRFRMETSALESAGAAEIWSVFADPEASNIELRKSGSAATSVSIRKYYAVQSSTEGELDEAKDSLGRLWDRLEENPLTSVLFHGLTRRYLFHVELFLDEQEFLVFWQAHGGLKLMKIQLRHVHPDGLPYSPIGDREAISADIIMRRTDSAAFLAFMKEHLPHVRFNPGKHSM